MIKKLEGQTSIDIINYIKDLPNEYKGIAANTVLKNTSISLSELENKIDEHIVNHLFLKEEASKTAALPPS